MKKKITMSFVLLFIVAMSYAQNPVPAPAPTPPPKTSLLKVIIVIFKVLFAPDKEMVTKPIDK